MHEAQNRIYTKLDTTYKNNEPEHFIRLPV